MISGNSLVSKKEILEIIENDSLQIFKELDLKLLEEKIEKNVFVKEAVVLRDPLGVIKIEINERVPFAVLTSKNNSALSYLDEEGIVLQYRNLEDVIDVPLISISENFTSNIGEKIQNKNIINILNFLRDAKSNNRIFYYNVSEMKCDNKGNFIAYSAEKGLPILIGKNNIENKINNLNAFLLISQLKMIQIASDTSMQDLMNKLLSVLKT